MPPTALLDSVPCAPLQGCLWEALSLCSQAAKHEALFKQFLSIFQLLAFVSTWGLSKLLMTSLLLLPTVPRFTLSATLNFLPKGEQYRGLSSESHACPGQEWTLGHWGS